MTALTKIVSITNNTAFNVRFIDLEDNSKCVEANHPTAVNVPIPGGECNIPWISEYNPDFLKKAIVLLNTSVVPNRVVHYIWQQLNPDMVVYAPNYSFYPTPLPNPIALGGVYKLELQAPSPQSTELYFLDAN